MAYPNSPQWKNGRFENPPDWPRRSTYWDFFRWQLSGRPRPAPGFRPPTVDNDGAQLRADRRTPSVTWIGHATLLVQSGDFSVITDPVFASRVGLLRRTAPPGVPLAGLPPLDLCIVSHNHRDHLDTDSIRALGPEVTYVAPLGLSRLLRSLGVFRVIELDWWQSSTVMGRSGGVAEVTLLPAQHWSQRGPFDGNQSLWGGFHLALPGANVYFAGDTGYPASFAEIGRRFPGIDFALLPIGAYEPRWFMKPQHLGPEDAALAFGELGAQSIVPMHWGTFWLADEPMHEPPIKLRTALGSEAHRMLELAIGQTHWAPAKR